MLDDAGYRTILDEREADGRRRPDDDAPRRGPPVEHDLLDRSFTSKPTT